MKSISTISGSLNSPRVQRFTLDTSDQAFSINRFRRPPIGKLQIQQRDPAVGRLNEAALSMRVTNFAGQHHGIVLRTTQQRKCFLRSFHTQPMGNNSSSSKVCVDWSNYKQEDQRIDLKNYEDPISLPISDEPINYPSEELSRSIVNVIVHHLLSQSDFIATEGKLSKRDYEVATTWCRVQLVCKAWHKSAWHLLPPQFLNKLLQHVVRISSKKWKQHRSFCQRLMLAGADPTVDNHYAFWIAAERGHADVVELMMALPSIDPTADDNHAAYYSAKYGHTDVFAILFARVDVFRDGDRIFLIALEKGHTEAVKMMLRHPKSSGLLDSPEVVYRKAVYGGSVETVKAILEDGRFDPGVSDSFILKYALGCNHYNDDIIQALCDDERLDPSADDFAAVQEARSIDRSKAKKIIKKAAIKRGRSPLHPRLLF
ncbi:putative ankyrin repeat-containing protein [Planoprotostelium fungivorum]|uniref:Putative ankyrin repeat-containing protein n=1 Tax=Planoprotostelium fungivorum TaxID=1890364 RepID=A0A2P6NBX5_9EUKA|nr:putative ankyrin repeat-containing protein [Planoprotostelium fungivorum]